MMALRCFSILLSMTVAHGLDFAHTWNRASVTRSYNLNTPSTGCTLQGMAVVLDPDGTGACGEYSPWANDMCILVVCPQKASSRTSWQSFRQDGDSEDVEFIAALIRSLQTTHSSPADKVIITGFSFGGSMSYRVWCERSDVVTGMVAMGQTFIEPTVGQAPKGTADPMAYVLQEGATARSQGNGCTPSTKRPHYAVVGTQDNYYGENGAGTYRGKELWERMSTTVLGCTGSPTGSNGASITVDASTCYEYSACTGLTASLNKYCSVPGRGHSTNHWQTSIRAAFANFFSSSTMPSPMPSPMPSSMPSTKPSPMPTSMPMPMPMPTPMPTTKNSSNGMTGGVKTCIGIKKAYQDQKCCENPMGEFKVPMARRLSGDDSAIETDIAYDTIIARIENGMKHIQRVGGAAKAKDLAEAVTAMMKKHIGARDVVV